MGRVAEHIGMQIQIVLKAGRQTDLALPERSRG